jgi:(1->4)-alpha-D-glucan 1-alpha-D-glucosylmutase
MLATSTHDSKRSEDVRARINALSEIPGEWLQALNRWRQLNRSHKTEVSGQPAPAENDEYLLYQTLLGAWPAGCLDETARGRFLERMREYMRKAAREAKIHTSWVSPNAVYEEGVTHFVDRILNPTVSGTFLESFLPFQARISRAGVLNSLAQLVIKITSPGVPDFYQGSEVWNYTLVDPDNRGRIDYGVREAVLRRIVEAEQTMPASETARALLHKPEDGAIKLYVMRAALSHRRAHQDLYSLGAYQALRSAGPRQKHLFAFARQLGRRNVIAAVGRFFLGLDPEARFPVPAEIWGDTSVVLRKEVAHGVWRDLFTGRTITASANLRASELFEILPVALLVNDDVSEPQPSEPQPQGSGSPELGLGRRT